ncbi:uncharacterized protein N7496_002639 [Penicillium cataractarum]|uniref:Zn(2)-C6 fungal-type domain-containing protein n=1 Tax=Penicillium cataractarum TaxID=2100454 RepID=A0A9W9SKH0_9EURO|nr:uncharacterized protein N7496_002639 [Penicillium cataractarum]KAJ5380211.1 hypothetical protein N7496_002639 [Penicillium cataractarum]
MAGVEQARKRSASVCARCRRQKIKCSGSYPCHSCSKRGLSCNFNKMDQKVLVTRGYISELQQKIARMEKHIQGHHDVCNSIGDTNILVQPPTLTSLDPVDCEGIAGNERSTSPNDIEDSEEAGDHDGLVNPLVTGPPAFMSPGNERIFYLGTSSNWSFTRRVLSVAHQHVHKEPLPTESLIFEGASYNLDWDGWRTDPMLANPIIPSLDHAQYLINAVGFRCGGLYHLFDETDFMKSLHDFYSQEPPSRATVKSLWYIHFLLILAFGKSFTQHQSQGRKPPGTEYFVKALQLLPDHYFLYSSPMISTEILCCIALFYQSLDCRSPAHNYVGQAMRLAMAHGMHTDMPIRDLGLHAVERCRKIWWTVYILDRHMSSIQGLPQSIDDRFVQAIPPSFPGSPERARRLSMHIKLCRSIADINSTVYAVDGRINRRFLLNTKVALSNIAGHADELRETFPLYLDGTDLGIPRTSAYLHLLYQQCVIVATRPLLFCFLKIRLESPEKCIEFLNKSRNIRNLILMCIECSQHSIEILHSLKSQGLLENFLNLDLESVFISTVVLLIGPIIDPVLVDDYPRWLEKAYAIFREMVASGNEVAKFRWTELQQLDMTLHATSQDNACNPAESALSLQSDAVPQLLLPETGYALASMDHSPGSHTPFIENNNLDAECGLGPMPSSAEMMAMADSIEIYHAEWVSSVMIDHDIW